MFVFERVLGLFCEILINKVSRFFFIGNVEWEPENELCPGFRLVGSTSFQLLLFMKLVLGLHFLIFDNAVCLIAT